MEIRAEQENQDNPWVLIVDDDPFALSSLTHMLKTFGIPVQEAPSLEAAYTILNEEQPDVLITDIMLGDGSGLDLLHWASRVYPSLPVILVTGQPNILHIPDAVKHQACDYVSKPVTVGVIKAAVQRALDRRRLLEDLIQTREMNEILCQVMARAVEAKDHFTAGHSQRVAGYGERLAFRLGLSTEQAGDIRIAGQLHDIGKIGIEDHILTAPRSLTPKEWKQIKKHPTIAVDILRPLPRLEEVRGWIYEHHERWDGQGYPRGIRGEEISLPGRILILVEVFDALHTRRSYKEPWSMTRIIDFFREQQGCHFDPQLAGFFIHGLSQEGLAFLGASKQQELFI